MESLGKENESVIDAAILEEQEQLIKIVGKLHKYIVEKAIN